VSEEGTGQELDERHVLNILSWHTHPLFSTEIYKEGSLKFTAVLNALSRLETFGRVRRQFSNMATSDTHGLLWSLTFRVVSPRRWTVGCYECERAMGVSARRRA